MIIIYKWHSVTLTGGDKDSHEVCCTDSAIFRRTNLHNSNDIKITQFEAHAFPLCYYVLLLYAIKIRKTDSSALKMEAADCLQNNVSIQLGGKYCTIL
jgi:hypothetical protein